MDCIFCKIINGEIPSYKLYEDEKVIAILDINPKSCGHTLIIPKNHTLDIYSIDNDTLNHILKIGKDISMKLSKELGSNGITFAQNNGICQDVKHFHLHIIPSYNNMPNYSPEEVYKRITSK